MSIWTWFAFFLGLYAGTYVPKDIRIKFEDFIASIFNPRPKSKPQQPTPQVNPVGAA